MGRRTYRLAVECAHPGCRARSSLEAKTHREMSELRARQRGRWRCSDHFDIDERLTPERPSSVVVYQAGRLSDLELAPLFWMPVGFKGRTSGFAHGPGFTVRAGDWPEGTLLRVTAEVVVPDNDRVLLGQEKRK